MAIKTKFLSVCIGISIVLFSFGFLIRSFTPLNAQTNLGGNLNSESGRYQMQLNSFAFSSTVYYRVLVYDTQTGKSKQYISSSGSPIWEAETQNLPASPL